MQVPVSLVTTIMSKHSRLYQACLSQLLLRDKKNGFGKERFGCSDIKEKKIKFYHFVGSRFSGLQEDTFPLVKHEILLLNLNVSDTCNNYD